MNNFKKWIHFLWSQLVSFIFTSTLIFLLFSCSGTPVTVQPPIAANERSASPSPIANSTPPATTTGGIEDRIGYSEDSSYDYNQTE